jgi:prepilin-type N-terminal cleavage/methylation domain-containing protein
MVISMSKSFGEGALVKLRGFTLVELIAATAILSALTALAIPVTRITIQREENANSAMPSGR